MIWMMKQLENWKRFFMPEKYIELCQSSSALGPLLVLGYNAQHPWLLQGNNTFDKLEDRFQQSTI